MKTNLNGVILGAIFGLFLLGQISLAAAQSDSKNQPEKTISITTQGKIEVPPDFAILQVSIHTYGATHQQAYDQNLQLSTRLLETLKSGGVKQEDIQTSALTVDMVDRDERTPERQFESKQSWSIRTEVKDAQTILDLALKSGANESSEPTWDVKNHADLRLQALRIASRKAKDQAEAIATALGLKLVGVYSAESGSTPQFYSAQYAANVIYDRTPSAGNSTGNVLRLYPRSVSETATVTVLFSIQ